MVEVNIKYNPYKLETEITINGEAPKANSELNNKDGYRLQEWMERLPQILREECNTREYKIIFHGTTLDFEDLDVVVRESQNLDIDIQLEHIPAQEVGDKEAEISEIFREIQAGPFEELKQPDVVNAFQMAKSSDFAVNVVATMSAGKSTLINALLYQKLMPSKQEACTAIITEIKDNDSEKFHGAVYDKDGDLIQSHHELTYDLMSNLNSDPSVSKIRAEGNIPFVTAEDVSLVLIDTPGPNNSRDKNHKIATTKMLSESSKAVVLYILNATQLAVTDDNSLLEYVAKSMSVGGKQSRDRFIFVVNKLDEFKKGEDDVKASLEKVRNYLADKGIENANIYPTSALTALNIRTILKDSLVEDEDSYDEAELKVKKFNRNEELHFEKLAPLSPSAYGEINAMLATAREEKDANAEALIHTGIVSVEKAIQTYVRKYAKTAKIKNIVDTFSKKLESAKSFETVKQEIAVNQDKHKAILENIDKVKSKLNSGKDAQKFKEEIDKINYDSQIKKAVNNIITASQNKITNQFESVESKMSKYDAERICKQYAKFADDLQVKVQIELEELIDKYVYANAQDLLKQYRNKLSDLAQDIKVGEVKIDPFELMQGDISVDAMSLIDNLTDRKRVKVGEKWVENTNKKWYKPWTWFEDSGYYKDVYEEREYVDGTTLSQRFFAPIQESLYENSNNAIAYAKNQTNVIKREFTKKFNELDLVLKQKLSELEACTKDCTNIEKAIEETRSRLQWLEDIQRKTNAILEI